MPSGALLVGILPSARFTAGTTVLARGAMLLLCTDGITEARTGEDRTGLYGDEALLAFAATHPDIALAVPTRTLRTLRTVGLDQIFPLRCDSGTTPIPEEGVG
ncbi:SpoIIE family protein phosphatase [Streptomyces durhamensis]|uniref:SpoIIE family protein phosphatase n=1 Tax=Streptomyces durhamensis TaxID=68194 RepID=UPI0004CD6EDC